MKVRIESLPVNVENRMYADDQWNQVVQRQPLTPAEIVAQNLQTWKDEQHKRKVRAARNAFNSHFNSLGDKLAKVPLSFSR